MKLWEHLKEGKWVDLAIALCIAVLAYLAGSHIYLVGAIIRTVWNWIYPVVIGLILAYIIDPLVKTYEKLLSRSGNSKLKTEQRTRSVSVLLAIFTIMLGLALILVALIPAIVDSVTMLINNIGVYAQTMKNWMGVLEELSDESVLPMAELISKGEELVDVLLRVVPSNVSDIAKTTISMGKNLMNWILGSILGLYFLFDKKHLLSGFARLMRYTMSDKTYSSCSDFFGRCHTILIRYIVCDLLDGLVVGCANAVFMMIAGMPYISIVSIIVGVTNLAPTFGPFIGGTIGALILIFVNPWYALWFLVFTVVLQVVDGYVLKPKLFGDTLGVPSVWILVFIVVGSRMLGVVGVLISIPCAAIFNFVYHNLILVRLAHLKKINGKKAAAQAELGSQSAEQVVEQAVGKAVEKVVEKAVEKAIGNAVENAVENVVENAVGNAVGNAASNAAE